MPSSSRAGSVFWSIIWGHGQTPLRRKDSSFKPQERATMTPRSTVNLSAWTVPASPSISGGRPNSSFATSRRLEHPPSRSRSSGSRQPPPSSTGVPWSRCGQQQGCSTSDSTPTTRTSTSRVGCVPPARTSWLVPAARASHRGSTSGVAMGRRRAVLLYSNRWLVLARTLGRAFPACVPKAALRDVLDLSQGKVGALALALAWLRVVGRLRQFARLGPPQPPSATLRRYGDLGPASAGGQRT